MEVSRYCHEWIEKCAKLTGLCPANDANKLARLARETHRCLLTKSLARRPLKLSVPPMVDAVWHNMILDTKMYAAYCKSDFSNFLEHTPFTVDDDEDVKRARVYKLLALYVTLNNGAEPAKEDAWIWEGYLSAPLGDAPSTNKKRRTSKRVAAKERELSGGRKNIPYTFNGSKYVLQAVNGLDSGDLRRILARRHHADIIIRGYGDGIKLDTEKDTKIVPMLRPDRMQLFIKGLGGSTHTFDVPSAMRVEMLKLAIFERLGHPPGEQRLIFAGAQLEDGLTLASYDVMPEQTIHLLLRLRGC